MNWLALCLLPPPQAADFRRNWNTLLSCDFPTNAEEQHDHSPSNSWDSKLIHMSSIPKWSVSSTESGVVRWKRNLILWLLQGTLLCKCFTARKEWGFVKKICFIKFLVYCVCALRVFESERILRAGGQLDRDNCTWEAHGSASVVLPIIWLLITSSLHKVDCESERCRGKPALCWKITDR